MGDAFQKRAAAENELAMLRVEIAKWQQRVPKITELLRNRSDALAASEQLNRQLRRALAEEQEKSAQLGDKYGIPVTEGARTETEEEAIALRFELFRLKKELGSLETRNRMLAETVEVLTHQFSRANTELLAFRRTRDLASNKLPNEAKDVPAPISVLPVEPTLPALLQIRGVGIKTRQRLVEAGINSVEDLALIGPETLDDPASPLFSLGSRIRRERWVEQARQLLDRYVAPAG
jgi:predicted flap endonuclease-1-like 5' DNA nuclease